MSRRAPMTSGSKMALSDLRMAPGGSLWAESPVETRWTTVAGVETASVPATGPEFFVWHKGSSRGGTPPTSWRFGTFVVNDMAAAILLTHATTVTAPAPWRTVDTVSMSTGLTLHAKVIDQVTTAGYSSWTLDWTGTTKRGLAAACFRAVRNDYSVMSGVAWEYLGTRGVDSQILTPAAPPAAWTHVVDFFVSAHMNHSSSWTNSYGGLSVTDASNPGATVDWAAASYILPGDSYNGAVGTYETTWRVGAADPNSGLIWRMDTPTDVATYHQGDTGGMTFTAPPQTAWAAFGIKPT